MPIRPVLIIKHQPTGKEFEFELRTGDFDDLYEAWLLADLLKQEVSKRRHRFKMEET